MVVQGRRVDEEGHRGLLAAEIREGKEYGIIVFHLDSVHFQFAETVQGVGIICHALLHKPLYIILRDKKIRNYQRVVLDVASSYVQHPCDLVQR